MRTLIICLLGSGMWLCFAGSGVAYLPGHWNEPWARRDPQRATAIIIGRATEIAVTEEMEGDKDAQGAGKVLVRSYLARVKIGDVIKGDMKRGDSIELYIGSSALPIRDGQVDETRPVSIFMHNTQSGYDVRVNNVYYMALTPIGKTGHWDLASGPFSLGLVLPDKKIKLGRLHHDWSDEMSLTDFVTGIKKSLKSE